TWQDHRVLVLGQPHRLQALGQPAHSDVVDTEFVECAPRGPSLGKASVHDHQIGWVGEFSGFHLGLVRVPVFSRLAHTGDLATAGTLLQIATEPAADHLVHGRDVVLFGTARAAAAYGKTPVLGFAGQAVLEHNHGGHSVLALEVGDVVALDAQGCLGQVQGLLDLVESTATCAQITGPVAPVPGHCLTGVLLHGLHEGLLVTSLRHTQVHPGTSARGEPGGDRADVGGFVGDQHLAGHCPSALVGLGAVEGPVQLSQEGFHEFAGSHIGDLVDDVAALTTDSAPAYVEDLHRRLELALLHGDDVTVGGVGQNNGLFLQSSPQRGDVVTQTCRTLVLHLLGGLGHAAFQFADEPTCVTGQEGTEVLHQTPMLFRARPAHTRCHALVDVAEQARTATVARTSKDPGRAGAYRKHPKEQIDGLPNGPGMGIGTEVAHPLAFGATHDLHTWKLLVEGDGEVGIAFVVAVLDVEPRVVLLDPGVLQLQCLDLVAHHGPVHIGSGGDHLLCTR